MYTATTPTITLSFAKTDIDLTDVQNIYVTFSKPVTRALILEKTTSDLDITSDNDNYYIGIFLSQEETLKMPCNVLIQANFTYTDGTTVYRACSDVVTVSFKKNLKEETV